MPISDRWVVALFASAACIGGSGGATAQSKIPGWMPPVMSAVLPGSGQLARRAPRGLAYLAVEAGGLTGHVISLGTGRSSRDRYRSIAFTVARGPFQPATVDTSFEYYEAMSKFLRSGPFDTDPGPALVPPTDLTTFNGRQWDLARRTFFADPASPPPVDSPAYQQALAYYRERAVGPAFEWSWEGREDAFTAFRAELDRSDAAFRRATLLIGVVLLNHVVSTIDAVVTERLASGAVGVRSEVAFDVLDGGAAWWRVGLRVAF